MNDRTQVGRVAFRHEGELWNAYYARPDTMQGAIFLGSIRMNAVLQSPARKNIFMQLMQSIVHEIIAGATGTEPTWPGPEPAPEHERSGSA